VGGTWRSDVLFALFKKEYQRAYGNSCAITRDDVRGGDGAATVGFRCRLDGLHLAPRQSKPYTLMGGLALTFPELNTKCAHVNYAGSDYKLSTRKRGVRDEDVRLV
jgi:hypothetical protein